ncbi:MAG: DNA-binding protein [Candidatus Margulisbacteria bacterium]|nr:DNA-binding protein [Candidatus Margulisiibacteriota bacterium]
MHIQPKHGRVFIGRLEHGADLLEQMNSFCRASNVRLGTINVIGAVTCAKMGYYDQEMKTYTNCVELNQKLEISSCMGNISIKDGEIFVHAHICLSDFDGKTYGGHLMPGTHIFAAEFFIQELLGPDLVRAKDKDTGLPLWS